MVREAATVAVVVPPKGVHQAAVIVVAHGRPTTRVR
jgi:hypothetical protein